MTKPSFIYFDVGGVVIKDFSDSNKWQKMQEDLGVTPHNQATFDQIWAAHREEICLDYDVDNYLPILRQKINHDLPPNYSMLKDFVDRFEPNTSISPLIDQVRENHKIGLLTNMYPRMLSAIFARRDLEANHTWDCIVDSSVVMAQKPDHKIFDLATQMSQTPKEEILFVDNSQEHTRSAQEFGWQTFWYDSKDYEGSTAKLKEYLALGRF